MPRKTSPIPTKETIRKRKVSARTLAVDMGLSVKVFDPKKHPKEARMMAMLGATREEMADYWDVSVNTVMHWIQKQPEFRKEYMAGRTGADMKVAASLFKRATGWKHRATKIMQHQGEVIEKDYIERYPADTQAAIFWLTNRKKDQWRQKAEIAGDPKNPITFVLNTGG